MSKEGINVCIRVRPFIQREIDAGEHNDNQWIVDSTQNTIQSGQPTKKPLRFDNVFDDYNTNADVYTEAAFTIIKSALRGVNGTILAYGQTSSGKTFTMSSIMKQAFADIFEYIQSDSDREYTIKVCCYFFN